jgi:putative transposase
MKNYNPNLHHRRSIRLKRYDYSQAGLYFITLCIQNRNLLFGHIENAEMKLNSFGEIAFKEWLNTAEIRDNIRLHEFIIMPDHMHGIIEIIFSKGQENNGTIQPFQSPSQTIGSIIRGYKISTIKKIKDYILSKEEASTGELQFAPIQPQKDPLALIEKIKYLNFKIWQRNYYESIIRNDQAYLRISNYIINNPKKWTKNKLKGEADNSF